MPPYETFAERCEAICHKLEIDWDDLHALFSPAGEFTEAVLLRRFDLAPGQPILAALVAAGILEEADARFLADEFGAEE